MTTSDQHENKAMPARLKVLMQEKQVSIKGKMVDITLVTFEEPFCKDLNYCVEFRQRFVGLDPVMYCFPIDKDELIPRYGYIFEGYKTKDIEKLIAAEPVTTANDTEPLISKEYSV